MFVSGTHAATNATRIMKWSAGKDDREITARGLRDAPPPSEVALSFSISFSLSAFCSAT
jgi:hypothetical protein